MKKIIIFSIILILQFFFYCNKDDNTFNESTIQNTKKSKINREQFVRAYENNLKLEKEFKRFSKGFSADSGNSIRTTKKRLVDKSLLERLWPSLFGNKNRGKGDLVIGKYFGKLCFNLKLLAILDKKNKKERDIFEDFDPKNDIIKREIINVITASPISGWNWVKYYNEIYDEINEIKDMDKRWEVGGIKAHDFFIKLNEKIAQQERKYMNFGLRLGYESYKVAYGMMSKPVFVEDDSIRVVRSFIIEYKKHIDGETVGKIDNILKVAEECHRKEKCNQKKNHKYGKSFFKIINKFQLVDL